MLYSVNPSQGLVGRIALPASKSYSIRAFIIAACGGRSVIVGPSDCEDAQVARKVAEDLGSRVVRSSLGDPQTTEEWMVDAGNFLSTKSRSSFDVGESGTALRFLLPLLALRGHPAVVKGKGTLKGRPNHLLTRVLRDQGVDIRGTGETEGIPLRLTSGRLRAGRMVIDGSLSSQFISALLIACPLLERDSEIVLTGRRLVSTDYIVMTLRVLERAGIVVRKKNARCYQILGRQVFKGLGRFRVPSDYGLAAFLMGAAVLTDSRVTLEGCLRADWPQADGRIMSLLPKMGVNVRASSRSIQMRPPYVLKGGSFSLKACPDLVPIMAVLALFARGTTRLTHIHHARAKESDRISDLREELLKVGARVEETDDALTIVPQPRYLSGRVLEAHRDHRLAMAFAVLGAKIGVNIKGMECVAKSYPGFIRDFKALGFG